MTREEQINMIIEEYDQLSKEKQILFIRKVREILFQQSQKDEWNDSEEDE